MPLRAGGEQVRPARLRRAARAARSRSRSSDIRSSSSRRRATPRRSLPWLAGQRTALIGQSGMGKSTILNAIAPDAAGARRRRCRRRSPRDATRRRNSTLHRLPAAAGDGWIVDTPGLKAFGLAHIDAGAIAHAFVELRPLLGHCRFRDCRHRCEPGARYRRPSTTDAWRRIGSRCCTSSSRRARGARPRTLSDVALRRLTAPSTRA